MKTLPLQMLSYQQKSKSDFQWAKDVMDRLLLDYVQNENIVNSHSSEYLRKLSNYQLYNNQLNQTDFERECNPLGIEVGQFKDAIQPYNKTYNKIQVLLGEELARPFNFKAILVNAEGVKSKLAHKTMLLKNYITLQVQRTIQSISELYSPEMIEENAELIIPPDQLESYMSTTYLDSKEITANKLLNYLMYALNIKEKKNDAFKHALLSGEEVVYVGHLGSTPVLEVVNSLGVFYHKSAETKYIQDAEYAGYRTYMTTADVLDKYGQYLTEDQKKKIDKMHEGHRDLQNNLTGPDMQYGHDDYYYDHLLKHSTEGSYSSVDTDDHLVQHVEWKSQRKVGFLTYYNEFGDKVMDIVSEDFELPEGYTKRVVTKEFNKKCTYYDWEIDGVPYYLEWTWIPEVWTGTKIGNDLYCMIGPKELQFRPKDNPYEVKLGYHGVIYNAMNASPISLMDRMKPFQYLYFIIMHKLKKLIAHDQGKVFPLDVTMIDPKIGLEKTFYYLKEMNIDIYNPLQSAETPGLATRAKVSSAIDMSNMQHIINYVSLLSAIDQQIAEVAGVTRQREGQTSATEAVSNAQANIQMSAVITEIFFNTHARLWESILSSLVTAAKYAIKNESVIKQFVLPDLSVSTLAIDGKDMIDSDFGVFITDSSKEHEMFKTLRAMSEGLLNTNRAKLSDLITLYDATSLQELKAAIKSSEKTMQEEQMQMQQQQIEAQKELQQSQQEFEMERQQKELDTKILVAQIQSFSRQQDQDLNQNKIPDQLEIEKFAASNAIEIERLNLEREKFERSSEQKDEDLEIKRNKASGQ